MIKTKICDKRRIILGGCNPQNPPTMDAIAGSPCKERNPERDMMQSSGNLYLMGPDYLL